MKYGYIKNDNIFEIITVANNGEWQSGAIERRSDGERLTADEMIAKHNLKPITTPQEFNGRYGDYNFAETETEIKLLDMTDTAKKETNKKQIEAEIISLKKQLAETDYITIKYSEAKSGARVFNNGEEEKCLSIIAEREVTREKIRLLELQL